MQVKRFKCLYSIICLLLYSCGASQIESNNRKFSTDIMRTLALAIKSYELEEGKLPKTLYDMVPIHCQPGKNGFKDGWGKILYYDNFSGELISCGSDGILHSKDDLHIKQDGTNNF